MKNTIESIAQRPIIQICWVVDNMEQAALRWVDIMGAGPFFLMPQMHKEVKVIYRGKPTTLDQSFAIGQWGPIQVELIEQHCNSPVGFRDMFAPGQIQHVTWMVDDLEAETRRLEAMGFPKVLSVSGIIPGSPGSLMRANMFDAKAVLGIIIEVYEKNDLITLLYSKVAQAAKDWKGENPIRQFHELGPV